MKKILTTIILAAISICAFCVTDYSPKDNAWSYNDGVFTFNTQYFWTEFALREDKYTSSSSIQLTDLIEMGFYKIENGTAGNPVVMFQRDGNGDMAVRNSVILNSGDQIGIYAKIKENVVIPGHYAVVVDGEVYTSSKSTNRVDGKKYNGTWVPGETNAVVTTYTTTKNAIPGAVKNTNNVDNTSLREGSNPQYFCLFLTNDPGPVDHFEYYLAHAVYGDDYDQFIDAVNGQNTGDDGEPITVIINPDGNPHGQPLPETGTTMAVMAAFILASFASKRFAAKK